MHRRPPAVRGSAILDTALAEEDHRGMVRALAVLGRLTTVGVALGVLVGGVGGRLAMLLLARLNPEATGVVSDDGFEMGRFMLVGTLNLLFVTAVLGALGTGLYVGLRQLRIGPRWFQVASIGLGCGVVAAAFVVHRDGVDFPLLGPLWLAIGLFVALPTVFAGLLCLLGERSLEVDDPAAGWWWRPALVVWVPLAPLLLVLGAGWLLRERMPARGQLAWAARAVLAGAWVAAVVDVTADAVALSCSCGRVQA